MLTLSSIKVFSKDFEMLLITEANQTFPTAKTCITIPIVKDCYLAWFINSCCLLIRRNYPTVVATGICPNGVPMVRCFADPCTVNSCPGVSDASCRANYCGGCHAYFYDANGNNVTDQCSARGQGGREGEKEGDREGDREGEREGDWEGGREQGRKRGREGREMYI